MPSRHHAAMFLSDTGLVGCRLPMLAVANCPPPPPLHARVLRTQAGACTILACRYPLVGMRPGVPYLLQVWHAIACLYATRKTCLLSLTRADRGSSSASQRHAPWARLFHICAVHVCIRVRERMRPCACACGCVCLRVCLRACVCARARACVRAHVCVDTRVHALQFLAILLLYAFVIANLCVAIALLAPARTVTKTFRPSMFY